MNNFAITPREFDALTRLDFTTFVQRVCIELSPGRPYQDNFHIHLLASEAEKMRHGDVTRLIVTLPPRNLKSIVLSVAFSAWLLGHDPSTKIACVSYSQQLSAEHAGQCRRVMLSPWYRRMFPGTVISPSRSAAEDFETTRGGSRFATSVDGTFTGLGADYIIIDDPVNAQQGSSALDTARNHVNRWYRDVVVTRLNDKRRGRILIVMQRLHEDDLVGHVKALDEWRTVSLPAIALAAEAHTIETHFGTWTHHREEGEALHPDREPIPILQSYLRIQGTETFSSQFQQLPVRPGGNLIKIDEFQRFDLASPPAFERIVLSWDTANKATELSGYSVCTAWGIWKKKIYLLDVVRERLEYPELRATSIALAKDAARYGRTPDTILIEDKASGQSLIQDLKRAGIYNLVAIKPEADKVTRMSSQTALIANRAVFIPKDAPWLGVFEQELVAFPLGRHADQVDSLSQVLKWFCALNDEPALATYYKNLAEQIRAPVADGELVRMRPKDPANNVLILPGRPHICPGPDGVFLIPARFAKGLRVSGLWVDVIEN